MKYKTLSITTGCHDGVDMTTEQDCSYVNLGTDALGIAVDDVLRSVTVESGGAEFEPHYNYHDYDSRAVIMLSHGTGFTDGVTAQKWLTVAPITAASARRLFRLIERV